MLRSRRVTVLWLLSLSLLTTTAAAQPRRWASPAGEPTEAQLEEARDLYERGSRAVDAYRFADGLRFFERAYELSGQGAALFGIGFALQGMGRFRHARDAFDQLLAEHPNLPDEFEGRAERFQAENASRIAMLELAGLPVGAAEVELDGASVPDSGARPLGLEVDPGNRHLRVTASGYEPFEWSGRLREGERMRVDVALALVPTETGGSLLHSPWLWAGVGVAAVLAAIVVGVVLYDGAQLDPRLDEHIVLCESC